MKNTSLGYFLMLGLILTLSTLSSCKKDDNEEPTVSKETLLAGSASKSWKITAIKGSSANETYKHMLIDVYNDKVTWGPLEYSLAEFGIPAFPDCAKDNIIVFKIDSTYSVNEGSTICTDTYEFDLTSGTWSISSNGEKLLLDDASGTDVEFKITELTEQKMEGETDGDLHYEGQHIDYTVKTTFSAQ